MPLDFSAEIASQLRLKPQHVAGALDLLKQGHTAAFIARFDSSGNPDPSFGTNGVTTTSLEGSTYARFQGVARQGDGQLVAVGY